MDMTPSTTYTVFVTWTNGGMEEIDVFASSVSQARYLAQVELDKDYEPNWTIVHVEERFGLFL